MRRVLHGTSLTGPAALARLRVKMAERERFFPPDEGAMIAFGLPELMRQALVAMIKDDDSASPQYWWDFLHAVAGELAAERRRADEEVRQRQRDQEEAEWAAYRRTLKPQRSDTGHPSPPEAA